MKFQTRFDPENEENPETRETRIVYVTRRAAEGDWDWEERAK